VEFTGRDLNAVAIKSIAVVLGPLDPGRTWVRDAKIVGSPALSSGLNLLDFV